MLFYCIAGALIAVPERLWLGPRLSRSIVAGLGLFFVGMAVLQAWPGRGSWQGQSAAHPNAGGLPSMVQAMSTTSQPAALSSVVRFFGSFDGTHGWAVNLAVVVALTGLGLALLSRRPRVTFAAWIFGIVLCLADWILIQDLGFFGGLGTDPNSMVPTVLLLTTGYLGLTRHAATESGLPVPAASAPTTPRRLFPGMVSPVALAVVAAFGVVLVGAVPMAVAAANPHTDAIASEALNGQPQRTDSPAPPFHLIDQFGATVDLTTLRGRTVVLTFLDPVCTSDCPLIAQQLRQVDQKLAAADQKKTVFVAVVANPTYRATPFLKAFDTQEHLDTLPNWYFLTGSLAQLMPVWNAYGVQVQTLGSGGMTAHSDTAFVIDAAGNLRSVVGADPGDGTSDAASFATVLSGEMRRVPAA